MNKYELSNNNSNINYYICIKYNEIEINNNIMNNNNINNNNN